MVIVAFAIGAYLIGGIPFGYLVARSQGIDILHAGSGNIGATNVYRTLGKKLGLSVFLLDVLKGMAPSAAAWFVLDHSQTVAFVIGLCAVAGHCVSPFLRFRGGKGISTGLGALLGSCPAVALSAFATFLVVLLVSRYVSLSSIVASISLVPFGLLYHAERDLLWMLGALTLFVVLRHQPNIKRLSNGSEPKFSFKGKSASNEGAGKDENEGDSRAPKQAAIPARKDATPTR